MTIAFNSDKLAKSLSSEDEVTRAFGEKALMVWRRLVILRSTANLMMLQSIEVLNCRQGATSISGHWLLKVQSNYSMVFLIDHNPIPLKEDGTLDASLVTRLKIVGLGPY